MDRRVSVRSSIRDEKRKSVNCSTPHFLLFCFSFGFVPWSRRFAWRSTDSSFLSSSVLFARSFFSSRLPSSLSSVALFRVGFSPSVSRFGYWCFLSPSLASPRHGPSEPRNLTSPNPRDPLFLFTLQDLPICQSTRFPRKCLIYPLWISPGPFERAMAEVSNTRLYLGNLPRNGMLPAFHRHHHYCHHGCYLEERT